MTIPLKDLHLDFGTRPCMPALPEATDQHRRAGRQLAAIHRHHLMELSRVGPLIDQIEAGLAPPKTLEAQVSALDLMANMRVFGTLCGRNCQVLTFHHDAEKHQLFPLLEAAQHAELSAVIARLREEHEVVHEPLTRLTQAAKILTSTPSPGQFSETRAIYTQLLSVVKSHFGYEETELEEALGLYAPMM